MLRLIKILITGTYFKMYTDEYFSDGFPVQNNLKWDALSPLLCIITLDCHLSGPQENQEGLDCSGMLNAEKT
jgi:hypothetical protein